MDEQTKYERIESYLAGTMVPAERLQFEQELTADSSLADELELHRQLQGSLRGEKIHEFRAVLQAVDKQWQKPAGKPNRSQRLRLLFRPALAVAAAVALLLIAWQLFSPNGRPDASEQLFAAYFEPYQMVLNQRSAAELPERAGLLNTAIKQYAEGQFADAAIAFRQLEQSEPGNIAFQFYQALALLASGQADEAIPILENVLARSGHLFSEQCRWYLALAHLKRGQEAEAKQLLDSIGPGQFRYAQSRELLGY
jgi:tetratricopeptide (TPR) repeat protein